MPGRPPRADQIDRYVAMTLAEIAEKLGVTPQAVRHVERRALQKIKIALLERKIVTREGHYNAS